MKLNFQFHSKTPHSAREKVTKAAREAGAKDVHPLFPGESDPELAAMQVAEVDDPKCQEVVRFLRKHKDVAFVEEMPARKLIR